MRPQTENVQAYHLYQRGYQLSYSSDVAGLRQSIDCFERALVEEPGYAQAYAFLGAAKLHFDRDWEGAEKAILKGLEINPQVPTRMPCTVGS